MLDIGCGSGRHTAEAYRYHGITAIGADRNHDDLLAARDRLEFHDRLKAHGGGAWCLAAADALAPSANLGSVCLIAALFLAADMTFTGTPTMMHCR